MEDSGLLILYSQSHGCRDLLTQRFRASAILLLILIYLTYSAFNVRGLKYIALSRLKLSKEVVLPDVFRYQRQGIKVHHIIATSTVDGSRFDK